MPKCVNQWSSCSLKLAPKRRGNDARMPFSLIYFFAPVSIFYILHNYVIPQAMPHAIPQTHSAFYPHRLELALQAILREPIKSGRASDSVAVRTRKRISYATHTHLKKNFWYLVSYQHFYSLVAAGKIKWAFHVSQKIQWAPVESTLSKYYWKLSKAPVIQPVIT